MKEKCTIFKKCKPFKDTFQKFSKKFKPGIFKKKFKK